MSDSIFTIYTYGGGEVLYIVFNAIAGIFKNQSYKDTLIIAANLVGAWVALLAVIKHDGLTPLKWIGWFYVVMLVFVRTTTSVLIHDPITNFDRKVDNVPYVLATFAGVVSSIGHNLTELMETSFSVPDHLSYNKHGLMFGSRIIKDLDRVHIQDGEFNMNMQRFIDQCVVLEAMMGGVYKPEDVYHSDDIWGLVSQNANPILGFKYREKGTEDIYTCKEGVKKLEAKLKEEVTKVSYSLGARIFGMPKDAGALPNTGGNKDKNAQNNAINALVANQFQNNFTSIFRVMSDLSKSAEGLIRQEMMINAIEDYNTRFTNARAVVQQRELHHRLGDLASNTLLTLKVMVEVLAYSMFLFVVILVMLPNGLAYVAKYFSAIVWVQLWAPIYALLNLIMSVVAAYQSKGFLGSEGLSFFTSSGLASLHADLASIAAMASASVPMIAYKVLQGGADGLMGMASAVLGSSQQVANSVAVEAATGNYSLGNVSMGGRQVAMVSGYKHDMNSSFGSGSDTVQQSDGASVTSYLNGSAVANRNATHHSLGQSINMQKMMSNSVSSALTDQESRSIDLAEKLSAVTSSVYSKAVDFAGDTMKRIGNGELASLSTNISEREELSKFHNMTKQVADQFNISEREAADYMMQVGAGTGMVGKALGIEGSIKHSASGSAEKAKMLSQVKEFVENEGYSEALGKTTDRMLQGQYSSGDEQTRRLQDQIRADYNEAKTYQKDWAETNSKIKQLQQVQNAIASQEGAFSENAINDFVSFLGTKEAPNGEIIGNNNARITQIMAQNPGWVNSHVKEFMEQRMPGIAAQMQSPISPENQKELDGAQKEIENAKSMIQGENSGYRKGIIDGAEKQVTPMHKAKTDENGEEGSINTLEKLKPNYQEIMLDGEKINLEQDRKAAGTKYDEEKKESTANYNKGVEVANANLKDKGRSSSDSAASGAFFGGTGSPASNYMSIIPPANNGATQTTVVKQTIQRPSDNTLEREIKDKMQSNGGGSDIDTKEDRKEDV